MYGQYPSLRLNATRCSNLDDGYSRSTASKILEAAAALLLLLLLVLVLVLVLPISPLVDDHNDEGEDLLILGGRRRRP